MKKFPQIKWYQTETNVYIDILDSGNNFEVKNEDIFLKYEDDIYEFNLELFDLFTLVENKINGNKVHIILTKNTENEWDYLLKNRKLYKYFISLNWDKYIQTTKTKPSLNDLDENFNEEEFKYLLESGELDKISTDSDADSDAD